MSCKNCLVKFSVTPVPVTLVSISVEVVVVVRSVVVLSRSGLKWVDNLVLVLVLVLLIGGRVPSRVPSLLVIHVSTMAIITSIIITVACA